MIAALLLFAGGLAVLWWQPRTRTQGAAPRSAVAMLLAAAAAVWAGSFGAVVGVITGETGDTLTACGVLWRHLVAGHLAWRETTLAVVWILALPARGLVALTAGGLRSRRLAQNLLATGVTSPDEPAAPSRTLIVPGLSTTAVTLGVLRPVILVDQSFWHAATPLQRRIVLAHEQGHRRGRHVLVDGAARFLTAGLVPLLRARATYDSIRRCLEALADDAAARHHDAQTVGVELGRIALTTPSPVGLGASGAALWRVERLLQPAKPRSRTAHILLPLTATLAVGLVIVLAEAAQALGPAAHAHFCPV
jgi:hypothetical protein